MIISSTFFILLKLWIQVQLNIWHALIARAKLHNLHLFAQLLLHIYFCTISKLNTSERTRSCAGLFNLFTYYLKCNNIFSYQYLEIILNSFSFEKKNHNRLTTFIFICTTKTFLKQKKSNLWLYANIKYIVF